MLLRRGGMQGSVRQVQTGVLRLRVRALCARMLRSGWHV